MNQLKLTQHSKPLSFKVSSKTTPEHPAPRVLEAENDMLDPVHALNGARVRVEYKNMRDSDVITVRWDGTKPASIWESEANPGSAYDYLDIVVPAAVVAASQGTTIRIVYLVKHDGYADKASAPLDIPVGSMDEDDLPIPSVPEALDGELNLELHVGDATVKVTPWKLIAQGQRYWIKLIGTMKFGQPHTFYAAQGEQVLPNEISIGLSKSLPRSELEIFDHNNPLTVEVSVSFTGELTEDEATPFRRLELKFYKLPYISGSENFANIGFEILSLGVPFLLPSGISVELLVDRNHHYNNSINLPGSYGVLLSGQSKIRMEFPGKFRAFSARCIAAERGDNLIEYFNGSDSIAIQSTPQSDAGGKVFEYTAPPDAAISRIELTGLHSLEEGYWTGQLTWS